MQQDASDALSNLDHAFGAAMKHNRALMESAANFVRGESFRFLNLRADRNRAALERFAGCHGVPGVLTVQKEWLGEMMQDYTALGQRQAELWQQGAEHLRAEMERQTDTARQMAQSAMDEAMEAQESARHVAEETANGYDEARQAMTPDYHSPAGSNDQMH